MISDVPHVSKPVGVVQAVVNLILPGFGTMITACAASDTVSKTQLSIGLVQFLTSVVLVGYIWALYWSYLIAMKAFNNEEGT